MLKYTKQKYRKRKFKKNFQCRAATGAVVAALIKEAQLEMEFAKMRGFSKKERKDYKKNEQKMRQIAFRRSNWAQLSSGFKFALNIFHTFKLYSSSYQMESGILYRCRTSVCHKALPGGVETANLMSP